MRINVEYRNEDLNIMHKEYNLSLLGFLKHIGFSGSGENINILTANLEGLGFFLQYHRYFTVRYGFPFDFWSLHRPDDYYHDPTKIAQFSNIIAKGITDFLARKISKAKYTHSYEAALLVRNIAYSGERPDLFCDTGQDQFSIESKGTIRETVSEAQMEDYKKQASSGPIPVRFSIASACFNLFDGNQISVKYFDPPSENYSYEKEFNQYLAKYYYTRILQSLERYGSRYQINSVQRDYITYRINIGFQDSLLFHLNKQVLSFINNEVDSVIHEYRSDGTSYFDVDGIGIEIR